jgi:hypothetical protein
MKRLIAAALFVIFGVTGLAVLVAAAQAKPSPMQAQPSAFRPDDLTIATGASGATLEQDYFRATPSTFAASRAFPCRLQLRVFDKTRLAQACH